MSRIELFNEVNEKFKDIVGLENGLVNCFDIVVIAIPKSRANDFCFPDRYGINAVDIICKAFPKVEVKFKDIDKISFKYNLVKFY